jgi:hypothetical protein
MVLGELDDPPAALRLLRELRSGDALVSRADPTLPVIVRLGVTAPTSGCWTFWSETDRRPRAGWPS